MYNNEMSVLLTATATITASFSLKLHPERVVRVFLLHVVPLGPRLTGPTVLQYHGVNPRPLHLSLQGKKRAQLPNSSYLIQVGSRGKNMYIILLGVPKEKKTRNPEEHTECLPRQASADASTEYSPGPRRPTTFSHLGLPSDHVPFSTGSSCA